MFSSRKTTGLPVSLVAILCATLAPDRASAQCELAQMSATQASADGELGFSVAIGGQFAVLGAPKDDGRGANAGAAFVFKRDGFDWVEHSKLTASDADPFDLFGSAVSISGDYIVVGAPADDDRAPNAGAVYVFKRTGSGWTQEAKLTTADAAEDDEFGLSVAIDGRVLVAGARSDDAGTSSGAAYVYQRNGTSWQAGPKLTANDASGGDQFGLAVAISGDRIIIGARHNDDAGTDSGSVYVFQGSQGSWTQQAKLAAGDASPGDEFGVSVAIDGNYLVVGARLAAQNAEANAGAAYVFRKVDLSWTQEARLQAGNAGRNDQFGNAVAIHGATVVVGAWRNAAAGLNAGAAYAFRRSGTVWTQIDKLHTDQIAAEDDFGFAVAIDGDYAVAGVPRDDGTGLTTGSGYLFAVAGDCNLNGTPDACDILAGTSTDFDQNSIPDECATPGDRNGDGDVDLMDIQGFQNCYTGIAEQVAATCELFDMEPDGDVDSDDLAKILAHFDGP